jgi:hypothetical protein
VAEKFDHHLLRYPLSRDEAHELHARLVSWMAEQPDRHPRVYDGRQSWGGDPSLLKGGSRGLK